MAEPTGVDINATTWTAISDANKAGIVRAVEFPTSGNILISHSDASDVSNLSERDAWPIIQHTSSIIPFEPTQGTTTDRVYAKISSGGTGTARVVFDSAE